MKKYVAIIIGSNHSSGLKTKEGAYKWATDFLAKTLNCPEIMIAEVQQTVKRDHPPFRIDPYLPEQEEVLAESKASYKVAAGF